MKAYMQYKYIKDKRLPKRAGQILLSSPFDKGACLPSGRE